MDGLSVLPPTFVHQVRSKAGDPDKSRRSRVKADDPLSIDFYLSKLTILTYTFGTKADDPENILLSQQTIAVKN